MDRSLEQVARELEALLTQAQAAVTQAADSKMLEEARVQFLGRKGKLAARFSLLGGDESLSREEKAQLGQKLNAAKRQMEEAFARRLAELGERPALTTEDPTLPGIAPRLGRMHPVTQTIDQTLKIFKDLGFSAVEGPEVETEHYNFEALNIPPEHPSRENFDTFYLKATAAPSEKETSPRPAGQRLLLRSHTSPVQIRFMESHAPPFKIVVPGAVYRPDAVDASHSFQFHQVEGLAVGKGLSFGDLKGVLSAWALGIFGKEARLRFRPHYFPFTEPSAEADLACVFCQASSGGCRVAAARGSGTTKPSCRVCGGKGWLEILGCGMVHPAVFEAVGYPVGTVGFAFGMGVERIAMLRHGIEDIRLFFENDLRFLRQFP